MHYEARPVSMAHNVSLAEFWYEKFPWNHVTTFILMATSVFYIVSGDVVKFMNWDVISGVF